LKWEEPCAAPFPAAMAIFVAKKSERFVCVKE